MDLSRALVDDYFLVGVGDDKSGAADTLFSNVRKLGPAERARVVDGKLLLKKWLLTDHETFSLVEHSFGRLKSVADEIESDFREVPRPSVASATLAINNELLNFLSMTSMYLDHTRERLKGKIDDEFERFEHSTNEEFDSHFSYRLFSKLRNYALHRGFPVTGVDFSDGFNEEGTSSFEFHLDFVRDELLENSTKWGAKVRSDLEAQTERFAVMPLAEEEIVSLRRIHTVVVKQMLPRLKDEVGYFEGLIGEVPATAGSPTIVRIKAKNKNAGGHEVQLEIVDMPLVEIQLFNIFSKEN